MVSERLPSTVFRTDLGMWFSWDDTNSLWVSEPQTIVFVPPPESSEPITDAFAFQAANPSRSDLDILTEAFGVEFYVNGGGGMTIANCWVLITNGIDADGDAVSMLDSYTRTIVGPNDVWHMVTTEFAQQLDAGIVGFTVNVTKTGTPGGVYLRPFLRYRLVAD